LSKPSAVLLFDAMKFSEQLGIRVRAEFFRPGLNTGDGLGIKDADLFQQGHVFDYAGKRCVEAGKQVIDLRLLDTAQFLATVKISVSHGSSNPGIVVRAALGALTPAWPALFYTRRRAEMQRKNNEGAKKHAMVLREGGEKGLCRAYGALSFF
jgi:hypothetical protein